MGPESSVCHFAKKTTTIPVCWLRPRSMLFLGIKKIGHGGGIREVNSLNVWHYLWFMSSWTINWSLLFAQFSPCFCRSSTSYSTEHNPMQFSSKGSTEVNQAVMSAWMFYWNLAAQSMIYFPLSTCVRHAICFWKVSGKFPECKS